MIHAATAQQCLAYRHNNLDTGSILYTTILYMMKAIAIGKTYNGDIRLHVQRALKKNGVKADVSREAVTNALYIKELSMLSLHGEFLIGGIPASFTHKGEFFVFDIFAIYKISGSVGALIFDPYIQHVIDDNMLKHSLQVSCLMKWAEEERIHLEFIEYLTLRGTTSINSRSMEKRNMTTNIADTNIIKAPVIDYNILDMYAKMSHGGLLNVSRCDTCKLLKECWDVKNRQF